VLLGVICWHVGYFDTYISPVRDNYVSPELKAAIRNEDIPFRILPEPSRFDGADIKSLLAYIRLAMDLAHTPLLCRVLEGPEDMDTKVSSALSFQYKRKEAMSLQAIVQLVAGGVRQKIIVFKILEQIASGAAPDTKPPIKKKAEKFVGLIQDLRRLMDQVRSILSI
jgi:superfamily I DNA/RNA helicase